MSESTILEVAVMAAINTTLPPSHHNLTDEMENKSGLSSLIMFSAGFLGNAMALILMTTAQPEQKQTMFYKLMAGLVCTDLIGTCATSPVVITLYYTGTDMHEGSALCHYFAFAMVMAGFSTMSIVCAMSIERYICMCHPYIYQCKLPKAYPKFALGFAWMSSATIASLPLMGLGHNAVQYPNTWCFFNATGQDVSDGIFIYIYVVIGFTNILVTFYCNINTIISVFTLRRRQRALSAFQGQTIRPCRSMSQRIAELHMIAMNFGVTIIFTTCYGPLMMCVLLFRTNLIYEVNTTYIFLLTVRIAAFNQILDPLVYILVRRDLRWKIIYFVKKILSRGAYSYNSTTPVKRNSVGNIDAINASNYSVNRLGLAEAESEVSIHSFCYHCLCDPPTYVNARSNTNRNRSRSMPSIMTNMATWKAASSESLLNVNEKCILRQPSRQESVELRNIIIAQNNKSVI